MKNKNSPKLFCPISPIGAPLEPAYIGRGAGAKGGKAGRGKAKLKLEGANGCAEAKRGAGRDTGGEGRYNQTETNQMGLYRGSIGKNNLSVFCFS